MTFGESRKRVTHMTKSMEIDRLDQLTALAHDGNFDRREKSVRELFDDARDNFTMALQNLDLSPEANQNL